MTGRVDVKVPLAGDVIEVASDLHHILNHIIPSDMDYILVLGEKAPDGGQKHGAYTSSLGQKCAARWLDEISLKVSDPTGERGRMVASLLMKNRRVP